MWGARQEICNPVYFYFAITFCRWQYWGDDEPICLFKELDSSILQGEEGGEGGVMIVGVYGLFFMVLTGCKGRSSDLCNKREG